MIELNLVRVCGFRRTLKQTHHVLVVRSLPIQPVAPLANAEFVIVLPRVRREAMADRVFWNRFEKCVAMETSTEWGNGSGYAKATEHFNELLSWLCFTHEVAASH